LEKKTSAIFFLRNVNKVFQQTLQSASFDLRGEAWVWPDEHFMKKISANFRAASVYFTSN
jgi:hypothetical protein